MARWRAGDVLCLAAGISLIGAAFLPWAQAGDPPVTLGALSMRLYGPFGFSIALGVILMVFAARHTLWAALVAFAGSFAVAMTVLAIHADVYGGLAAAGVRLGADSAHVTGYGVSALFAAGLLAGLGGVVVAIESEAPVTTRAAR